MLIRCVKDLAGLGVCLVLLVNKLLYFGKKMTKLMPAQNINFSGSLLSNEIYTKRE